MKTLAPEKIPDSPLFAVEIKDSEFGLHGWLVIHSFGARGSCGGVRLYPDVSREEVELLAKAMTYKYSFYEVALGGAKAAIRLPFDLSVEQRSVILKKFGEHVAPLIKSGVYCPWTDMNSSARDIMNVYQGAGVKRSTTLSNSAYFTALSTFSAVLAASEYYRIAPEQCKITIEGLGNVGRYLAIEIDRWGGKLIGASTRIGAVANLKGLDVKQMIEALDKSGDFWVKENGWWEAFPKEQLFSLPMNIHIPCARTHSINETVAERLNCKLIIPAANVPCSSEGEVKISKRGIRLLPDFVTNSGGIIGAGISSLGGSDIEIRNLFFNDFKEMVKRLLELSERSQISANILAKLESDRSFQKLWVSCREKTMQGRRSLRTSLWWVRSPKKILLKKRLSKIRCILKERFNCTDKWAVI